MSNWVKGCVTSNYHWTDTLFTLKLTAPVEPFEPGQFTKLRLPEGDGWIQRAYSYVNAPDEPEVEIYATSVADGKLSPRLFALEPGDEIWVDADPNGYLTLSEVPDAEQLWMISTGTGIGPFLSILKAGEVWHRFKRVVLVHGVRWGNELTYQDLIASLLAVYPDRFIYQPFVSREPRAEAISGRIPFAISDGMLERHVGLILSPDTSQIMICGNPDMIKDMKKVLEQRGFRKNLRRTPGHITTENYW